MEMKSKMGVGEVKRDRGPKMYQAKFGGGG